MKNDSIVTQTECVIASGVEGKSGEERRRGEEEGRKGGGGEEKGEVARIEGEKGDEGKGRER